MQERDFTKLAVDYVYASLAKAESYYKCTFPVGQVLFNLRGRAAGQVRFPVQFQKESLPTIRFNSAILKAYQEEFIREVVPHECAHLVVYRLYQLKKYKSKLKPKPHGSEWKFVMREIYGVSPRVTHTFDVKTTSIKRFPYQCSCEGKIHQLTVIRHNKICKQLSKYLCRSCGATLKLRDSE